ncbi:MAG: hypothetical protein OXG09_02820 [Chloroflexi bacterium]|nr:hypothetical protein [Chloroflexota bacterium]
MTLLVLLIFGTVLLGCGTLLSPAWPSRQPRIGLLTALALALVVGGSCIYATLFGWNTLVVDYLLFALVTTVFLGGTLSYGQLRAQRQGRELADRDQGWPGPRDLAFLTLGALVFVIPALLFPVPLDTDAQGFGYLALMLREGGDFHSLAPWHPEIRYLYAPGFSAIVAYLSAQIGAGVHEVQLGVGAVLGVFALWLAYDFGAELRDKRLGRAMVFALLLGGGLFSAFLDSHYTALLGLVFALAFFTFSHRWLRDGYPVDALAAALVLGALVLAHPDLTIITGLGFAPWLLCLIADRRARPPWRRWWILALGVPALAALCIAPWLLDSADLLGSDIVSPFERSASHWRVLLLPPYHGVWLLPLVVLGAWVGGRLGARASDRIGLRRAQLLALSWLVLVLDFSTTGLLARLAPGLLAPVLRYDYPFSIAWHGPIIPTTILGGMGGLYLWENGLKQRFDALLRRGAWPLFAAGFAFALVLLWARDPLLRASKSGLPARVIRLYGAFASADDVAALEWLRDHSAADARLLNFPAPHEGEWAPLIAERDAVYYRGQPFFRGAEASLAEQEAFRAFWRNPAAPEHEALLRAVGITHVVLPQIVRRPDLQAEMFRWREPFAAEWHMASDPADAPYLELVFAQRGAEVYAVVGGVRSNISTRYCREKD